LAGIGAWKPIKASRFNTRNGTRSVAVAFDEFASAI